LSPPRRNLSPPPTDDFDATFSDAETTVDFFVPDITLGTAIWLGGGGVHAPSAGTPRRRY
jgi:hypothetical protein